MSGDPEPAGVSGEPSHFRRARPDEAEAITALALRSKRLWGYDEAFMSLIGPLMTIRPSDIERAHVEVLESDGVPIGFLRLFRQPARAWLEDLFVEPAFVGGGYGRRLFERAVEVAREWGMDTLELESDPHAEGFYLALGAERIGMSPQASTPGRSLPLMRYQL